MSRPPASDHDAVIAELRARRRARVRVLAVRSAFTTLGLLLLAVVLLYWLLMTVGGRDVLLSQIVARLPADTTLTWRSAEGPASGPLTLRDVRFETPTRDRTCSETGTEDCPITGRIVFFARTIVLDPAIRPLFGRRLRLDALDIAGATLDLPKSDEPFELPRWPEVLPEIAPPLALQADTIRVDGFKVTQARETLIDIHRLRGGLDASTGRLHIEHVRIDSDRGRFALHGDYAPEDDYRTDLTASAVLPAPPGRTAPKLGLVARGELSTMDVALSGNVPAPLRATLTLRAPATAKDVPRWTLRANSTALDLGLLTGSGEVSTPLAFDVRAEGTGGQARLQGKVTQGEFTATILPSNLRLDNQVLDVQPLALQVFDGSATLRGRADFRDANNRRFRFAINARGLTWGGAATTAPNPTQAATDTPAIVADADLGFAGTIEAWAAIGKATLTRDGQAAAIAFDGRGDAQRMTLKTLRATMPTGTLDGSGSLDWAPALGWDIDATLAGFDPGYFAADWKGAVNGKLVTRGTTRSDGGLDVAVDASQLGGRLRGRPLQGRGRFLMRGAAPSGGAANYEGDVALTLGGSRLDAKGKVANTIDIDAKFSPLQLNDLPPDASGSLRGTLKLTGTRTAPNIDADLTGAGLAWSGYRAATLSAKGRLPWTGRSGALLVTASGVEAGIAIDTLRLDARGAVEALQLDGSARSELGALEFAGTADKRGANWQGTLQSLQLAPNKGAPWRLQSPARYAQNGARWTLSQSCFASAGGGALCASADWPRRLDVEGNGLPLTLALPYLPEREDGRPWLLRGEIAIDAQVRPVGNSWRGTAKVTSASGGLKLSQRARRDLVAYDNLTLDATFDPRRVEAELSTVLNGDGHVDARIATGWDAYAPLSGEIALDTDELTWMELFSPDIVEPTGRLAGRITLAGTRAQPALGGQAQLSDFATELPSLAILLQDGDIRMDALPDGSARISGRVTTASAAGTGAGGVLAIDGSLGWRGDSTPLVLKLSGKNVLVSDTRDVRAVIDPDVSVRYAAGQPITVTGSVGVPSAKLDLERLDDGVSTSPDVVVLDPVDPKRTASSPLDLDLTLALGDDVRLNGFGLEGTLGGSLRVRQRPGREMIATGTLEVGGRYEAYGQELDITRGRLVWSGTAIADPVLDIRAERKVGEVTAGIDVDGRASAPQARVWTDPASDESEALAYLALGRPLSSASADESRQLDAASAALSAGGSLLASQLGSRIGLDDAGVMDSRALGGSVFGVGKFLSPKLYVGYGVSLLGTGQVLTLKYLLKKGFDVEIESSTIENRGSVNWRKEK